MLSPVVKKETPEMTIGFLPLCGDYLATCRTDKETAIEYCRLAAEAYPEDYCFIFTVREKPLEHQGSFFGWD